MQDSDIKNHGLQWDKIYPRYMCAGAAPAVLKWSGQEVGVVGCGFSVIVQN